MCLKWEGVVGRVEVQSHMPKTGRWRGAGWDTDASARNGRVARGGLRYGHLCMHEVRAHMTAQVMARERAPAAKLTAIWGMIDHKIACVP